MEQIDSDRYIRRIQRDYADTYGAMRWLSPRAAESAAQIRQELLDDILSRYGNGAAWKFDGTKLFTHELSPGCTLCGEGKWSCLFINGVCNANCFYCPSAQKDNGPPVTSTVEFTTARDYADYVNQFSIEGVGFSGGEPLMTFERVIDYLGTLQKSVSRPLHTWMYTNGILVTEEKLKRLRDTGLREIRFDLSARDYDLDNLKKAVGIIPIITVEMPAIPDDLEKTKHLLHDLYSAGVDFLNLHQIRCTQFNKSHLIKRGYTFLHGTGVSVLETELTALELIRHALKNNIALPINYCSFTFRDQFQKAGARTRNASKVKKPWEDITRTGFLRAITLQGNTEHVGRVFTSLNGSGRDEASFKTNEKGSSLTFPARLWPEADLNGLNLKLSYSATALRSVASFRYPFTEIILNEDKKVIIEKDNRHPGIRLEKADIRYFAEEYLSPGSDSLISGRTQLSPKLKNEIDRFESFSPGLAPYF